MDENTSKTGVAWFVATWGPVVGLVGGLFGMATGGLTLYERFNPPSVEVLELIPVYISEPKTTMGAKSAIRGVGVVLHVKGGSRETSLTEIKLEGKRCVSIDEFPSYMETDGKTLEEIEAEFDRQRPFQQVAFSGLPKEHNGPLALKPWEENSFFFTFSEPKVGGGIGMVIESDYLGSQQRAYPKIRDYGFNVLDMFTLMPSERTSWTAGHLRNEILDGILVFRLIAGGVPNVIPPGVVRAPKRLTPDEWRKGDVGSIRAGQMPDLEVTPKENRSINCYFQTQR